MKGGNSKQDFLVLLEDNCNCRKKPCDTFLSSHRIDVKKQMTSHFSLKIKLTFPFTKVKLMSQYRVYGKVALGGEVGGYIGMILGLSVLHIPGLMTKAWQYIISFKHNSQMSE